MSDAEFAILLAYLTTRTKVLQASGDRRSSEQLFLVVMQNEFSTLSDQAAMLTVIEDDKLVDLTALRDKLDVDRVDLDAEITRLENR